MCFLPQKVFVTGSVLTALIGALVLLASSVFATQAGEVAFESNRDGNWEIFLFDVQTGFTHNLTRSAADDLSPSWSPDGSRISFTSNREPNRQQVFVIDADGSGLRRVSRGAGIYRDPAWTADGRAIALMHGFGQLFLVDPASGSEQFVAVGFAPQLSPDGRTLLFYGEGTSPANSHIFVLDLETRESKDLTADLTHNWDGVWSPDGRRIAFVSSRDSRSRIYLMNPDGSDLHAISDGPNDLSPAWTPDGERIVFSSGKPGAMRLYLINADGSEKRMLGGEGDSHAPVWRP